MNATEPSYWAGVPNPWQPIDTAPRDGTIVDIWHRVGFRCIEVWWTDDDCWSNGDDDSSFTHWMPCPPGPSIAVARPPHHPRSR